MTPLPLAGLRRLGGLGPLGLLCSGQDQVLLELGLLLIQTLSHDGEGSEEAILGDWGRQQVIPVSREGGAAKPYVTRGQSAHSPSRGGESVIHRRHLLRTQLGNLVENLQCVFVPGLRRDRLSRGPTLRDNNCS